MKHSFLSLIISLSFSASAFAADSSEQAEKLYAQRDYTADGMKSAKEAAEMFGRLAATTAKGSAKNKLHIGESKAYYFVGTAAKEKAEKINLFSKGMAASTQVLSQYMGELTDDNLDAVAKDLLAKYPAGEVEEVAHALYYQGTNLGSWAEANGVMQSLNKWPELRRYMEMVEKLGHHEKVGHYGAYRVLGRAYYKLPTIAGGDMKKAGHYLGKAFDNTQVGNLNVSASGATNVFYAEYLQKEGKTAEAIAILKRFVAADPTQVDANSVPETKSYQETAKALLDRWEE